MYKQTVRKKWQKVLGQPCQCKVLDVQLNLADSKKEPEQWRNVRLLFVRGNTELEKKETGKHDWAVFLSTDINLEPEKFLKSMLYAGR